MPELYQVIGSVLRDVAQARFTSDMYSRQISHRYEADTVLREFPVPRVEIDEVEIELHFAVRDVRVDEWRHTSRNASIGALFDEYSISIVRDCLTAVRESFSKDASVDAATRMKFEQRLLSDASMQMNSSRLLRYFNDNAGTLVKGDGSFDAAKAKTDLKDAVIEILKQQEKEFPDFKAAAIQAEAEKSFAASIDELAKKVTGLHDKYPDYLIEVDVAAGAIKDSVISKINIKSSVKNYKWSKVDVDDTDMRNIRTLSPE